MWPVFVEPEFVAFGGVTAGTACAAGSDASGRYLSIAPEASLDTGVRIDGNEVWVGLHSSMLRVPDGREASLWLAPLSAELGVGVDLGIAQGGVFMGGAPAAVTAGAYVRSAPVPLEGGALGLEFRAWGTSRVADSVAVDGVSLGLRWETRVEDGAPNLFDGGYPPAPWVPDDSPDDVRSPGAGTDAAEPPASVGPAPAPPSVHHDAPEDDAQAPTSPDSPPPR